MHAAGAAYTVGLLGGYLSRRGGAYATKALAVGAATAGYKFGQWWKGSGGVKKKGMVQYRRKNAIRAPIRKNGPRRRRNGRKGGPGGVRGGVGVGRKRTAATAFAAVSGGRLVRRRTVRGTKRRGGNVKTTGRYGKKGKTMTLVKMAVPQRILRIQGLSSEDSSDGTTVPGWFPMLNTISSSANVAFCPIYVVALNDTMQFGVASAGTVYQMELSSTGRVSWKPYDCAAIGSGTTKTWISESETVGSGSMKYRHIANNWLQIKLKMYTAYTSETSFKVELIQCMKDYAAIEDEGVLSLSTSAFVDKHRDEVYGYWQEKARPLVSNSMAAPFAGNRVSSVGKPYKVLRVWNYKVAPELTIERDTTPNSVTSTLFIRDGRLCDYQYQRNSLYYDASNTTVNNGVDDFLANANKWIPITNNAQPPDVRPAPRARRYLVISANSWYEEGAGPQTIPSFDMMIRKKEQMGPSI